ncbi:hypothetical protein EST38_g6586 [Candolleomyces aberdarensis]|uniref:NYN domain-containing protein n=1 Tax=Candolleomyces aberdarensis TaxID=2316362 RepID=A0A4Q2DHG5_9AGAR|nr:hypothetical protein EST38_g6586 [Candolleomyces aberdarensis]
MLCPPNGTKDAADKIMIVDMSLKFTYDNPPPATVILVSQDKDFSYALASLRQKQYRTVVIGRDKPASYLVAQADEVHVLKSLSAPKETQLVSDAPNGKDAKKTQEPKKDNENKGTPPASKPPNGKDAGEAKKSQAPKNDTKESGNKGTQLASSKAPDGKDTGEAKKTQAPKNGNKETQPASKAGEAKKPQPPAKKG